MAFLIVGLGNPGREYEYTKHNIGWDIFEKLPFYNDLNWKEKSKGLWASVEYNDEKFYFLKPQTYMNLSGESIIPFANYFKIPQENVLIIHDELDLNYGTVAFKNGGGLAGHNGLKSIASQFGNQNFKRLRIGIGRPVHGDVSNWVLSRFAGEEAEFFEVYLEKASKALLCFMKQGFQTAMQRYNKKKLL